MTSACSEFRAQLERCLTGEPSPENLTSLGWHEHLLGCGSCRELLDAEEALEYLLASLPDPKLPQHLVPRVLERLRVTREEANHAAARLDSLLEKAGAPDGAQVPANLAHAVLEGLALDRLLERVPVEPVPAGLSQRLLSALAPERRTRHAREEVALDALLNRVDVEPAPRGLVVRVLDGLEAERFGEPVLSTESPGGGTILRFLRSPLGVGAAAAATIAAVALGLWGPDFWAESTTVDPHGLAGGPPPVEEQRPGPEHEPDRTIRRTETPGLLPEPEMAPDMEVAGAALGVSVPKVPDTLEEGYGTGEPEEALLAALDLLEDENWDLFFENDDMDLLLTAFEVSDELLLDIDALVPVEDESPIDAGEADRPG